MASPKERPPTEPLCPFCGAPASHKGPIIKFDAPVEIGPRSDLAGMLRALPHHWWPNEAEAIAIAQKKAPA